MGNNNTFSNLNFIKSTLLSKASSGKSTIDWCESNYYVSEYIAEYWNTITGIFLIISGLIFYKINEDKIRLNNKYIQNRFINIRNLLILVGIGTMLFHGTLLYPFQLLDELPMIFLATEYIKILLELQTTQHCFTINTLQFFGKIVLLTSTLLPLLITFSYFINPNLQIIIFHITLKITEGIVILLLYRLSKRLNKISYDMIYKNNEQCLSGQGKNFMLFSETNLKNHSSTQNKRSNLLKNVQQDIKEYIYLKKTISEFIRSGLFFYGVSIFIWCIENLFCNSIQFLQLHAFWHILSSIGIYKLNTIILYHTLINKVLF